MQLIPAIDLLEGRVVRLAQGDYGRQTVFDADPARLARAYAEAGAEWLHVVDLDAAKDGGEANLPAIEGLCRDDGLKIQTGGGVRDRADLERRLAAGAERIVIGSQCVHEPQTAREWLEEYDADTLVVALDVRQAPVGGAFSSDRQDHQAGSAARWIPQAAGWRESGDHDLWTILETLLPGGLTHLLCTDISRDGMLTGPNTGLYREIKIRFPDLRLQASGGVGGPEHLQAVADAGADACIVGRALLEGKVDSAEIARWSR